MFGLIQQTIDHGKLAISAFCESQQKVTEGQKGIGSLISLVAATLKLHFSGQYLYQRGLENLEKGFKVIENTLNHIENTVPTNMQDVKVHFLGIHDDGSEEREWKELRGFRDELKNFIVAHPRTRWFKPTTEKVKSSVQKKIIELGSDRAKAICENLDLAEGALDVQQNLTIVDPAGLLTSDPDSLATCGSVVKKWLTNPFGAGDGSHNTDHTTLIDAAINNIARLDGVKYRAIQAYLESILEGAKLEIISSGGDAYLIPLESAAEPELLVGALRLILR